MIKFFFLALLVVCHCADQPGTDQCLDDVDIIHQLLNNTNYNKLKTPPKPVKVEVSIWIQDVNAISEITTDFTIDLYLGEKWHDPRLSYEHIKSPCKNNISLTRTESDKLWKPNVVFINTKQAEIHRSPRQNTFMMMYPNGTSWTGTRMKVTGPCKMASNKTSFDTASCWLTLESFNYNAHELDTRWNSRGMILLPNAMRLPEYKLLDHQLEHRNVQYPAGLWSELTLRLQFQRQCKMPRRFLDSNLEQCGNSTSV